MLKKFIFLCLILVVIVFTHSYFQYSQNYGLHEGNSHTSAVERFWYKQKMDFVEGRKLDLPLAVDIKSFDYSIGDFTYEGGTYYFKTNLVINEQLLRIESAVKAYDGTWAVDVKETFMGSHLATLDYFLSEYSNSLSTLNTYLNKEYVWGMGEGYSRENEEYLRKLISGRLKQIEEITISHYKETTK